MSRYNNLILLGIILIIVGGTIALIFFSFRQIGDQSRFVPHKEDLKSNRAKLGKDLFFDKRLSGDNTIACVSCHNPQLAFTDGKKLSTGVGGRLGFRNTPTLLNVRNATSFMFDAEIKSLEEQAIAPIQDHAEMDIKMGDLIKKLKAIPYYNDLAKSIYNKEFDASVLTESLAAFQRTLVSNNSKFDQFQKSGDSSLMTSQELEGWKMFKFYDCIDCHHLPNFTNYEALNIGLYEDYGEDQGRFRVTHDSSDMGKFKTPSLRNIALTAPYMHDGSIATLRDVILTHTIGFRNHKNLDTRFGYTIINKEIVEDITTFLETLTDTSYLINYR